MRALPEPCSRGGSGYGGDLRLPSRGPGSGWRQVGPSGGRSHDWFPTRSSKPASPSAAAPRTAQTKQAQPCS